MLPTEMVVSPVFLESAHVRLEPLAKTHLAGLVEVGLDEELWRWIPAPVRTREEMAAYIETALDEQAQGVASPFAIVEKCTSRAIGSTRYGSIDRARSEEHTSELQSQSNLVCRLLLEKKKD